MLISAGVQRNVIENTNTNTNATFNQYWTTMTTVTVDNDYKNYNDYRDRDIESDLVTQLTITYKLRNFNHDIEG